MNPLLQYIELNLTELCNYTCSFCPRGHGYPNSNLHMTPETASVICNQIRSLNQPVIVQFAGRGEPTLNKHFGDIAELFLQLRDDVPLKIEMNTNGKWVDKYLNLIDQFDDVVFNIYAENPESSETLQNKYKATSFRFKDKKNPHSRNWKTRAGYIPDQVNPEPDYNHAAYGGLCHKPFEVVYINWNGDYNLCCDVWHDIEVLGNIFDQPIKEYTTKNPRLLEYRKRLLQGKRDMSPCKDCNIQCSVEFLTRLEDLRKNGNRQSSNRG